MSIMRYENTSMLDMARSCILIALTFFKSGKLYLTKRKQRHFLMTGRLKPSGFLLPFFENLISKTLIAHTEIYDTLQQYREKEA